MASSDPSTTTTVTTVDKLASSGALQESPAAGEQLEEPQDILQEPEFSVPPLHPPPSSMAVNGTTDSGGESGISDVEISSDTSSDSSVYSSANSFDSLSEASSVLEDFIPSLPNADAQGWWNESYYLEDDIFPSSSYLEDDSFYSSSDESTDTQDSESPPLGIRDYLYVVLSTIMAFFLRVRRKPIILAYLFMNHFKYVTDLGVNIGGRLFIFLFPLEWLFQFANRRLVYQVSRKRDRSLLVLGGIASLLIPFVAFIYYTLEFMNLLCVLIFQRIKIPEQYYFFHNLANVLVITDFLVKFFTMCLKIGITALPETVLGYKKRGKVYLFIEVSSQLYRSLLPVYPWLVFFTNAYAEWPVVFQVITWLWGAFYIPSKYLLDTKQRVRIWWEAGVMLFGRDWKDKSTAKNAVDSSGEDDEVSNCVICHDNLVDPLMLQCKHIFCEKCITTWFSYQKRHGGDEMTCPMCRTKVIFEETMRFWDGSTLATKICI